MTATLLEITELANGDVVLREADTEPGAQSEPLVRIRFSDEVRDMLGRDLVSVAEAMIDAATEFLEADAAAVEVPDDEDGEAPTLH
jgi:hypothetical protein